MNLNVFEVSKALKSIWRFKGFGSKCFGDFGSFECFRSSKVLVVLKFFKTFESFKSSKCLKFWRVFHSHAATHFTPHSTLWHISGYGPTCDKSTQTKFQESKWFLAWHNSALNPSFIFNSKDALQAKKMHLLSNWGQCCSFASRY